MRLSDGTLTLSATDLANFLACHHRTAMDMEAAAALRLRPHFDDPLLEQLFQSAPISKGPAHVLGVRLTVPSDKDLILPVTWRLSPAICAFTSELFYESRLASKPALVHQPLTDLGEMDAGALWYLEVDHERNTSSSNEEVGAVVPLVARFTAPGRAG